MVSENLPRNNTDWYLIKKDKLLSLINNSALKIML